MCNLHNEEFEDQFEDQYRLSTEGENLMKGFLKIIILGIICALFMMAITGCCKICNYCKDNTTHIKEIELIIKQRTSSLNNCEEKEKTLAKNLKECKISLQNATKNEYDYLYIVAPGDWLSKIAEAYYKDYQLWPLIWWINQDKIEFPNKIKPKETLKIKKQWPIDKEIEAVELHKNIYKN